MVRTTSIDKSGLKKGTWTAEEDRKLIAYVTRYGCWNWRQLPRFAGLSRCGKSCRLRWMNYLRPNIKRGNYTPEEEEIIIKLHNKLGNRWSAIAAHLPGRTDNEIKNHWHTALKKKKTQQHEHKHEQSKNSSSSSSSHSSVSSISSSYSSDKSPTCRNTSCHVDLILDSTPLSPQTSFSSSTSSSAITATHNPNPILDPDIDLDLTQDFWSDLINISNDDDFFYAPTQTTTTATINATTCTSTSSQEHPSTSTSTISNTTFDLDHDDFSFLGPLSDAAVENFLIHPSSPQTTPSLSSELQYQYLYPSSLPFDDFDLWNNQPIF